MVSAVVVKVAAILDDIEWKPPSQKGGSRIALFGGKGIGVDLSFVLVAAISLAKMR